MLFRSVRAGHPLFAVSSPAVAELRTDREQAMVELDAATVNLQRVEATVASRALPMKELQTAQQRYKNAQLAVDLANRKLAAFKVSPGADHEFVIQSPRTGVVVSKDILVNQQVSAEGGAPLMVVADLSSVWAIADVFEGQTPDLKPGGGAEVTTPSLPGATFTGRILMVASVGEIGRAHV